MIRIAVSNKARPRRDVWRAPCGLLPSLRVARSRGVDKSLGEMQVVRWKLTPVASPDDPRWQGRAIWSEVIVEAPSAAFARQFAADWELADRLRHIGNESPSPKSGFEDEKLYWVRRVPEDEARYLDPAADAATRVLRAVKMAGRADEVSAQRRPRHS
jgi:hypothetical protein